MRLRIVRERTGSTVLLRKAARATRSGFQRYPRNIWRSLVEPAHAPDVSATAMDIPRLTGSALGAGWIGHATVLIRLGGLNILTDPVFSRRIGMQLGKRTIGLERTHQIPIRPAELPRIDLILISHAHFDHLDRPTLRRLASETTSVVTAEKTRRLIPAGFGEVTELRWGEAREYGGVTVRALRPAHWGARAALDRRRGYNSYLLETKGQRVLFAGDTAHTDAFDKLGRSGGVDLAVFGIGAYEPWIRAHANPEQVWDMFSRLRGSLLLPMHHRTFKLGDEPPHEPLSRLMNAAKAAQERIVCREVGDVWSGA